MSNQNSPERPAPAPNWLRWLFVPALAAWVWFQVAHTTTVASGSDSSGYLNHARLLASGRLSVEQRLPPELGDAAVPGHFLPLGFWMAPDRAGWLVPTYPPGLPLHLAVAGRVAGWDTGPWLVVVGGAVAALALLYLCAREAGVSPLLAATGAVALALSPQFLFSSFQPMSDTLATTWCLASFLAAWRARRSGLAGAVATGVVFSVAVLVRPTNLLLLPAVAIVLGDWRRLAVTGLAGLPGAVFFLWLNQRLYGHPLNSGYGSLAPALAAHWFVPTVAHFGQWLARLLPAVFLLLPFAALLEWRRHRRLLLALAAWWAGLAGFYAFYAVSHEVWWCLRFILPAFPALIIGALLGAEILCDRAPGTARRFLRPAVATLLVAWSMAIFALSPQRIDAFLLRGYENEYLTAARWAERQLPADALIVTRNASGALYYYTGFAVLRWDSITAEQYRGYAAALRRSGRPVYAMLFPDEADPALTGSIADRWEKVGVASRVGFWKLAPAPGP